MASNKTFAYVAGIAGVAVVVAGAAYHLFRQRKASDKDVPASADHTLEVCLLSIADSVPGQGVGSAYVEHVGLMRKLGSHDFRVSINRGSANADVVHLVSIDPLSHIRMRLTRRPTVASAHFIPETFDGGIRLPQPVYRLFLRYVVKTYLAADRLHVVNKNALPRLTELGIDPQRVTYIPNYVSADRFYPMGAEEVLKLRKAHGFARDSFVVMGCGQVQNRKGVQTFAAVARRLPDVQFVWAGGFSFGVITDGYDELKELMENPPANLRFTGIVSREEVNELLNVANLFFLPSFAEQFPMSILEAASTHTPSLVRDIPEYHNLIDDLLVMGSSEEDFVEAITRLRDDPVAYAAEVEHAVQIAETYSEERVYEQWKAFYLKACTENN